MTVFLSTTKQVTSESHLKTNRLVFKGTVSTQSFYMRFSFSPFTQTDVVVKLQLNSSKKNWEFLSFFVERAKNSFRSSSYHWMCRYHFYPQIITGVTRELDSKFQGHTSFAYNHCNSTIILMHFSNPIACLADECFLFRYQSGL